jgi:hypothetical protein
VISCGIFHRWPIFKRQAVVGNGGGESGGFTQIQELHPIKKGSKGGLGFLQWTGMGTPSKPGRRRVFENLLKEIGRGPDSYDANYEMLKRELKRPERRTIPKLRTARNIDEATLFFMQAFERPGIPHYEGRLKWSKMGACCLSIGREEDREETASCLRGSLGVQFPERGGARQTSPALSPRDHRMLLA